MGPFPIVVWQNSVTASHSPGRAQIGCALVEWSWLDYFNALSRMGMATSTHIR